MKPIFKAAAVCMSTLLTVQAAPLTTGIQAADDALIDTDFEDGDVSAFGKRGDEDTSVIKASTEKPHGGDTCMAITERSEGWNGPTIALSSIGCEPGVRYIASCWVRAEWYNTCMLSMQYTDADGEQHYGNLAKAVSEGGWVEFKDIKFSFSEEMKDVQIYIEAQDKTNLYVDDFSIKPAPVYPIEQDIPGLKDVYADYFKIGCATTAEELAPQSTKDLILKHFNSITLGNELKPENMLDKKATLAYLEESGDNTKPIVKLNGKAKSILNFARDNNIPVRGHVLVWYSQTPIWFFTDDFTSEGKLVDKDTMTQRMENYIKGVFEALEAEYSDVDFYAWDVVNEALEDGGKPRAAGSYEKGDGSSAWVAIYGDNSFIEPAFKFARQYAPKNCKLYYNDYNEYMKVDAMLDLALDLKEKGYLDGLGLQSHLNVTNYDSEEPFPTAGMYASALGKFAASGLDIQITELDCTASPSVANWEKLQAQYYSDIMDAIVKYKDSISAVVFWGTTDDQSWRTEKSPLLFDEHYKAKDCFKSIIDGITYTTSPSTATTSKTTTTSTTTVTTGTTTSVTSDSSVITEADWGNANGDSDVTVADAVLIARVIANDKTAEISDDGRRNADVTHDGVIDANDLVKLLKYLAGSVKKEQLAK